MNWLRRLLNKWKPKPRHRFKPGDQVIFVNCFGVVYLWTVSECVFWETWDGQIVFAYHHAGTQTPWFPTMEKDLKRATDLDIMSTPAELQKKYGFTPKEWYGCY